MEYINGLYINGEEKELPPPTYTSIYSTDIGWNTSLVPMTPGDFFARYSPELKQFELLYSKAITTSLTIPARRPFFTIPSSKSYLKPKSQSGQGLLYYGTNNGYEAEKVRVLTFTTNGPQVDKAIENPTFLIFKMSWITE